MVVEAAEGVAAEEKSAKEAWWSGRWVVGGGCGWGRGAAVAHAAAAGK